MKTLRRLCIIVGALAIAAAAVAILLIGGNGSHTLAAPAAQPVARPLAAPVPPVTCTEAGGVRTCELWAMEGTVALPNGASANIWGFTDSATGPAELPGPTLVVSQGEQVEVVLHNMLPEPVSLSFPGQFVMPDLEGVPNGGTYTYTFTADTAGTQSYEAGLTPNGARQVAMGLFGALIVRPETPGQAYDSPGTAFDDEALLVISEIDPSFNADPLNFPMEQFRPEYWLINGQAYPDTPSIPVAAGDRLLLRMLNAGVDHHSIGLLGLDQTIVALDGSALPYSYTVSAESLSPGRSMDTVTTVPTETVDGTRFALYNTALLNHNSNWRLGAGGPLQFGGMLTFIEVTTGTLAADAGPVVTSATASPDTTVGDTDVTLTFEISATNGGNVTAAEYFVNSVPITTGTGTPLALTPGPVVTAQAVVPATELATWDSGYYEFYARGQDDLGTWGAVGSAILNLDKLGPDVIGLSLLPNPTNGSRAVMLRGTADDHTHGNAAVISASYAIGAGEPQTMALNMVDRPIVEISALIPSADLDALAEGQHIVTVEAIDALSNPGTPATITLSLDKTGPSASDVVITPDYLDLSSFPAVNTIRLDASVADPISGGVQSNLATAEGFIGTLGDPGTGFPLFPSDGLFNGPVEDVYYEMPVSHFAQLAQGDHAVWVRGRDAAGNWGEAISGTITIDRQATDLVGPVITNVSATPNPTAGATEVVLTANAGDFDLVSTIQAAEWYVVPDPGLGNGMTMEAADGAFDDTSEQLTATIDVSTWNNGFHRIWVRAQDSAGNWGAADSVWLRVSSNSQVNVFADTFDAGLDAWSEQVGDVVATTDAQMGDGIAAQSTSAGMGMAATLSSPDPDPAYVALWLPLGERSVDISFDFSPNSTAMNQEEHDILVGLMRTPSGDLPIFGIQVEGTNEAYEVSAWVRDNGVRTETEWVHIPNGPVTLGLFWEAGTDPRFVFTVDGEEITLPIAPSTGVYLLQELRLGPSDRLDTDLSGTEYFDNFALDRMVFIYAPVIHGGR